MCENCHYHYEKSKVNSKKSFAKSKAIHEKRTTSSSHQTKLKKNNKTQIHVNIYFIRQLIPQTICTEEVKFNEIVSAESREEKWIELNFKRANGRTNEWELIFDAHSWVFFIRLDLSSFCKRYFPFELSFYLWFWKLF